MNREKTEPETETENNEKFSKNFSHEDAQEFDPVAVKRLVWKLDVKLMPFLAVLYLCSFLDRVNIGNAKIAGLQTNISATNDQYNWALSIFFIGYILFEVPSNLMLKRIGPGNWIPIVMVLWGVIMCAMSAVKNGSGLLAARFFLGVAEAGLYPGIVYYLSLTYIRRELALRNALFFSAATIAGAFGGVLAYGIVQMNGDGNLHGWQWIFILEGLPTIILAFVSYFYLPNFPQNAKFLTQEERDLAVARLKADAGPGNETAFSMRQLRMAFTDWKVYLHMAIYLCMAIPLYSLSLFLPTIISGIGSFSSVTSQLMTAPPYAIACVFTVIVSFSSDKFNDRGWHMAVPIVAGILGYALLISLPGHGSGALYVAAIITTTGVFANAPAMISWFSSNIGGDTKRGVATALIISFGNIGGAIGGQVYRANDGPYYYRGHTICLTLLCVGLVLVLAMKFLLNRENQRRDRLTPEEYEMEANVIEPCDRHPDFRYIS